MAEQQHIHDNAVKLLFAEDLISYVMLNYDSSFDFVKKAERFRNLVYNAFNDNVKNAIDFLTSQFHMGNALKFEILAAARMNNESSFAKLAEHLRESFFSKGFEARRFLYYCAHLSTMAGIFYTFGIEAAPYIAANAILKSLSGYPTQSGAWDTVNSIAEGLCNASSDDSGKFPEDSLVLEHSKSQSPVCNSPTSNDEASDEEPTSDFENGVLRYISLDEFLGIDNEWKNMMLPLLAERDSSSSSSDESNEDRQLSD